MKELIDRAIREAVPEANTEDYSRTIPTKTFNEMIKALESLQSDKVELVHQHNSLMDHCQRLQEKLDALPSMPAWVKCEERLPTEFRTYLVFDGEDIGEASWRDDYGFRWPSGATARVTQWSEMPAPPIQQEG